MVSKLRVRGPNVPITELEQSAFCQSVPMETKPLIEELKAGVRWQKLPEQYIHLSVDELSDRMLENRRLLGKKLIILGHHYQREDVIAFADFRGDSFKLSQFAANQSDSEYTLFCGVHFMAETAAILGRPFQKVLLPNMQAGCSMADMARIDDVLDSWQELEEVVGVGKVTPVTYMNSVASIKALCGRKEGIVCTSSNATGALSWAYQKSSQIIFYPDQHLGRNTGLAMGLSLDDMVLWNPFKPLGGNTPDALRKARLILWNGHCSVHTRFSVAQVMKARERYPNIKIMVHPECTMEVVQLADYVGSTEGIVQTIANAEPGSVWGVGTEINLVSRIAHENPDKIVFCLDPVVCPCSTMYRIHPAYLLWVTDELLHGRVQNQVVVDEDVAYFARVALDRMLNLT